MFVYTKFCVFLQPKVKQRNNNLNQNNDENKSLCNKELEVRTLSYNS